MELPGWRYPVVCKLTSGQVQFDNYGGRWGDRKQLDRLLQVYSVEKATGEAHRKGHSVAEFESEFRAERVILGQDAARKKGKIWGGSKKGWRWIWKVTDEHLSAICEMRDAGKPIAQIARETGLYRSTIYHVLEKENGKV